MNDQEWEAIITCIIYVALAALLLGSFIFSVAAVDGSATFFIKGVTVQDNSIFISNGTAVNLSYLPDHTEDIAANNPGLTYVKTLPDGVSEPVYLAAGEYTAYLRQGNGDQPEVQQFIVGEGITRVTFLGAAYASGDEGCCSCKNQTVVDEQSHLVYYPEVNETVFRQSCKDGWYMHDIPAWDEVIGVPAWQETVIDAPGHWQTACPDTMTYSRNLKCMCPRIWVDEVSHIVYHPEDTQIIHHPAESKLMPGTVCSSIEDIVVITPEHWDLIDQRSHEERVCGQKLVCPCGCVRGERE